MDAAVANLAGNDYEVLVAELDEGAETILVGYVCFGPTPMTRHTWDLYWIVSDPARRTARAGSALLDALVALLGQRGGRVLRIETSSTEVYGSAQRFYARNNVIEAGRIPDFYEDGDALLVLYKVIEPPPAVAALA